MKNIKRLATGQVLLHVDERSLETNSNIDMINEILTLAFPNDNRINGRPLLGFYLQDKEKDGWFEFTTTSRGLGFQYFHEFIMDVVDNKKRLEPIAIALLPSIIERAPIPLDHEQVVQQAYKFAKEVVKQGGGE